MKTHVSKYSLIYLAAIMIWLKTYISQKVSFDLQSETIYQEIILLISPISSAILMLAVGLFVFKKRKNLSIIIVSFVSSFILISNTIYFRFYHDFITLPVLLQVRNMSDLGGSILGLMHWWDLWVFIDFFVLLFVVYVQKKPQIIMQRKQFVRIFAVAISLFIINWGMAEIIRPGLLTSSYDRHVVVKSIGPFHYHAHDALLSTSLTTKKVLADSTDLEEAEQYIEQTHAEQPVLAEIHNEKYGIAEGKNVFIISMESTQGFVIDQKVKGKEITPFLNDLIDESYYFENFYHQTAHGKTSDSEFLLDNSLYPLPSGAVFYTHPDNTYLSTPKILKKEGYYSAVFHANDDTFWNRDDMYESLGYDRFFDEEDYTITDENSVGWGLKDIEFFEQSMLHLKYLPQPFYSKFITLTNHHPYMIEEEDQMIPEFTSEDEIVNRYFTTVRYMDEALKIFFKRVKEAGFYENSIFILYGDHYGLPQFHDEGLSKYLGKEITPFIHTQLQKVPMIIHIPGHEGKILDTVAGQIDIRPTLMNLLGVDSEKELYFGEDLFSNKRESFVVMRDGSFVTDKYLYTGEVCYLKDTHEKVESSYCADYKKRAQDELEYSDEIIYGDLLRFMNDEETGTEEKTDDKAKEETKEDTEEE